MTRPIDIDCIAEHEAFADEYALKKPPSITAIMKLLYCLECAVSNHHRDEVKPYNWNYIPYSHLRFYKALKRVVKEFDENPQLKFLEMGFGLGTKLHIATRWLGLHSEGIEINKTYVNITKELLALEISLGRCKLHHCDVRDFPSYGEYDIIYSYGEVKREDADIIEKVKREMKPGAKLMLATYGSSIRVWTKP